MNRTIPVIVLALLLVGCTSLYTTTVTITDVVQSAMRSYADIQVKGVTTQAMDNRVKMALGRYQRAAGVAEAALKTYKQGGDKGQYVIALEAVRTAVTEILDIITPMLQASEADKLKAKLKGANSL